MRSGDGRRAWSDRIHESFGIGTGVEYAPIMGNPTSISYCASLLCRFLSESDEVLGDVAVHARAIIWLPPSFLQSGQVSSLPRVQTPPEELDASRGVVFGCLHTEACFRLWTVA